MTEGLGDLGDRQRRLLEQLPSDVVSALGVDDAKLRPLGDQAAVHGAFVEREQCGKLLFACVTCQDGGAPDGANLCHEAALVLRPQGEEVPLQHTDQLGIALRYGSAEPTRVEHHCVLRRIEGRCHPEVRAVGLRLGRCPVGKPDCDGSPVAATQAPQDLEHGRHGALAELVDRFHVGLKDVVPQRGQVARNAKVGCTSAILATTFAAAYSVIDGVEGDKVTDPDSVFVGKRMENGWKNSAPWVHTLDPEKILLEEVGSK
jgi:hypothetical protein